MGDESKNVAVLTQATSQLHSGLSPTKDLVTLLSLCFPIYIYNLCNSVIVPFLTNTVGRT